MFNTVNVFPSLLVYGFFVPTLLRITAGIVLGTIAYRLTKERDLIAKTSLPIIGKPAWWIIWISATFTSVVGLLLIVGYYTQLAAIAGVIVSLKHGSLSSRLATILPLPRSAYVLLGIICFSLLFSGAGALAFDLPL